MTRLLLDQGLPRGAVRILLEQGWEVEHTGDVGLSRATDRQIIEYAREHKQVVVTLDADFHAIIAVENASRPSVVRIRREGLKAPDIAALLVKVWLSIAKQLSAGAMITINTKSVRIRQIPLVGTE